MQGTAPSLNELARRLQTSDRAAYAAIYRRLHGPLVRYVLRFTPDEATAYDVLQDVFMKLWERRETLTVTVSLKALLYTMARNRALNLNRRNAWMAQDADVADRPAGPAASATEEDALVARDLAAHLRRGIEALPPRRAEAFILSRYHGLKHREISVIMGLSERTVQTHVLHALRTLRTRLDALENKGIPS